MRIESTKLPSRHLRREQPAIEEKLTLPGDSTDLTLEKEWPSALDLAKGGAMGAAGGAALGGFAGIAGIMLGGFVDVVYGTAHASSIQVGVAAVAGAAIGAGFGAFMSGMAQRDEARDRNGFRELSRANTVSRAESSTFEHWAQINEQGWSNRESVPEKAKPTLAKILQSLIEREVEINATNPQEALLKLETRKLKVGGTKISHIANLQQADALNGGGLVVLDQVKRQTIDTLGRMHQEGFQFLRSPGGNGPALELPFQKAYESLKLSESDKSGHGFYLKSPLGGTYHVSEPSSLSILHALDGAGETPLPPLAEQARELHALGLRIGVQTDRGESYSKTPYSAYLNLGHQDEVTNLKYGGVQIAISTAQRDEDLQKLQDWGLEDSFASFEAFSDKMTYEAARKVTPKLLQSSDSLANLRENVTLAVSLFDSMKGGKGRFFLPNKPPEGYLRALSEKLADQRDSQGPAQ